MVSIFLLANSLGYYDYENRWYDTRDLKPTEIYPKLLQRKYQMKVGGYAIPWLTAIEAYRICSKLKITTDAFLLHVGIVESFPRLYPPAIRRAINNLTSKKIRDSLNIFENALVRGGLVKGPWIDPNTFESLVFNIMCHVIKFNPAIRIVLNIFHVEGDLALKYPQINRNICQLNERLRRAARQGNFEYLDVDSLFDNSNFLPDRIHLNARGHAKLAEILAGHIFGRV